MCLICHPFYWAKDTGRGIDRYNYELLLNLRRLGVNASVLSSGFIRSIPEGAIKELIFPLRLLKARTDLYHAVHPIGGKTAILTGKKPLITTVHDVLPCFFRGIHDFGLHYKFKFLSLKLAAEKSDRVITTSRFMKNILGSLMHVSGQKINVTYLGIDHDKFFPQPRIEKVVRRILFIGEVVFEKGIDTLLEAFRLVSETLRDVELVIGGRGVDLRSAIQLASKLRIDHEVRFLGYVPEDELSKHYNLADVFVFPSRYGLGMPMLEAMACGTPTIYGATFDAPEYAGDSAMPVDPDDPRQLADAIIKILADEDFSEALSKKGILRTMNFSWRKMAEDTLKIYGDVSS